MRLRFLLLLLVTSAPAAAQPLPLKRDTPPVAWSGCPPAIPVAQASEPARAEANALANEAAQALLLGDNATALNLLNAAAELDPGAERVAYRRARALELLGRRRAAALEYCRFLSFAPRTDEAAEVHDRIVELAADTGFTVPAGAAAAFARGVSDYDAGRFAAARSAFAVAAAAAPAWAAPLYNRGLAQLAVRETAAAHVDFAAYLALEPDAPDAAAVLDLLAGARTPAGPDAGTALVAGLLVPGLGHFTTGRPRRGALFLGAASSFAAAGVLVASERVQCLAPPADGFCPPDQVLRTRTERPLLLPALAAAAATGLIGAVDAYRGAQRAQRQPAGGPGGADRGLSLSPQIGPGPRIADLSLLRLRF